MLLTISGCLFICYLLAGMSLLGLGSTNPVADATEGCKLHLNRTENGLENDGILLGKHGNQWFYICQETDMQSTNVCFQIDIKYVSTSVYEQSDFPAQLTSTNTMPISTCKDGNGPSVNITEDLMCNGEELAASTSCCRVTHICCELHPGTDEINTTSQCRNTWQMANNSSQKLCYDTSTATVSYIQQVTTPKPRSWTASVLLEIYSKCEVVEDLPHWFNEEAKCLNTCLRTRLDTLKTPHCNCSRTCSDGRNTGRTQFRLIDHGKDVNVTGANYYCIVVETQGVSDMFTVEKCNALLPAFCGHSNDEDTEYGDSTDGGVLSTSRSYPTDSGATADDLGPPTKTDTYIMYGIGGVLVVLAIIIVTTLVICRKLKLKKKQYISADVHRINSVSNRTYDHTNRESSGSDTYALIMDGAVNYKPELPPRGEVCVGSSSEITTSDVYTDPADSIQRASHMAEYMVTYDDPIRECVKIFNKNEPKKAYDVTNLSEKRAESFKKKTHLRPLTKFDTGMASLEEHDSYMDQHEGAAEPNDYSCPLSRQSGNYTMPVRENDSHFEKTDIGDFTDRSEDREGVLANEDYEDTSTVSSPFNILSTLKDKSDYRQFTDHVCLDCLTPQHLKKLGIRIVSDDNLYYASRYENWPRRFSDSDLNSYVNVLDFDKSCASLKFDDEPSKTEDCTGSSGGIKRRIASCSETNTTGRQKNSYGNTPKQVNGMSDLQKEGRTLMRTCNLCNHDFYDTLEQFRKPNWNVIPDNEYNKLSDVRLYKYRGHAGNKCRRLKSCYD